MRLMRLMVPLWEARGGIYTTVPLWEARGRHIHHYYTSSGRLLGRHIHHYYTLREATREAYTPTIPLREATREAYTLLHPQGGY